MCLHRNSQFFGGNAEFLRLKGIQDDRDPTSIILNLIVFWIFTRYFKNDVFCRFNCFKSIQRDRTAFILNFVLDSHVAPRYSLISETD